MVFLILESLGSTELVFILLMALVFFGPRKLPQLSRTLGKNLASFRRASEDFKRTWDREVTLEEFSLESNTTAPANSADQNSILDETKSPPIDAPEIQPVSPELVIARDGNNGQPSKPRPVVENDVKEPLSKRDWL